MNRYVFDIEADGLIENATKIHCFCYLNIDTGETGSFTTVDEIRLFFTNKWYNNHKKVTLIGHNIIRYDIPMLEKFLGLDLSYVRQIDTLALCWYLFPTMKKVGLEEWGDILGIEKPEVTNWKDGDIELYLHRCREDVKINTLLWQQRVLPYLEVIYKDSGPDRLINYLTFKMQCAREQEETKWRLDADKAKENLIKLQSLVKPKLELLSQAMPKVVHYKIHTRPKKLNKKDNSLSALGQKWMLLLESQNLPFYHIGIVRTIDYEEAGNPGSVDQLKDWLFSLGWKPKHFTIVKDKKDPYGTPPRRVPQIKSEEDSEELCDSIKELFDKAPILEELAGLTILNHRIGILEGFLEAVDSNGFLKAEIKGFTNTLRFKHKKPVVNLPTLMKPYGQEIRGVLIAPDDNHVLCGSDVSGLEESTKHHYMFPYDPDYVREMRNPTYDAHLDIAIEAKLITKQESDWYKWIKAPDEKKDIYLPFVTQEYLSLSEDILKKKKAAIAKVRDASKKANFGAVYGAGAAKIALTAKITLEQAVILHTAYWKRNWAVRKIAASCKVRTIDKQMWLYNPVSEFYYTLKYDKDRFSTLNQGTGVYCFDTWTKKCREKSIKLCGQFHDEHISPVLKGKEQEHKQKLLLSMNEANEILNLNIKLGISIDFGHSYADIH